MNIDYTAIIPKSVPFEEIVIGETFYTDLIGDDIEGHPTVFMRVRTTMEPIQGYTDSTRLVNAVILESGVLYRFMDDSPVHRCNAELIITPKD